MDFIIDVNKKCKNCKGGASVCDCRCHKEGTHAYGCDGEDIYQSGAREVDISSTLP